MSLVPLSKILVLIRRYLCVKGAKTSVQTRTKAHSNPLSSNFSTFFERRWPYLAGPPNGLSDLAFVRRREKEDVVSDKGTSWQEQRMAADFLHQHLL